MAKHLTDRQKKQIIADYATLGTYAAVAKKHMRSETTVRRVVKSDPETSEKVGQKKDENTADILRFMDEQKEDVCSLISLYLKEMQDPKRISRASVQSLATALGIVIDKFTGTAAEVEKLKAEIAKLRGEGQKQEVHPLVSDLVAALKKRQEGSHAE